MALSRVAICGVLVSVAAASDILLATFDGTSKTSVPWTELNDPVMGGQSHGSSAVKTLNDTSFLVFDGEVVDVPKLKAPGFVATQSEVGKFPDASAAFGGSLVLSVRSSTPDYKGFKVTFNAGFASAKYSCAGGGSIPLSRGCFKAGFSVPVGDSFAEIVIPFSSFSDVWDPATGKQKKVCAKDSTVCPTAKGLAGIQMLEFMAEGAGGKIHLEVERISARPPAVTGAKSSLLV